MPVTYSNKPSVGGLLSGSGGFVYTLGGQSKRALNLAKLEASKPKRENFKTEEEFEEAHGYWMGHQGRILASAKRSKDSPPE